MKEIELKYGPFTVSLEEMAQFLESKDWEACSGLELQLNHYWKSPKGVSIRTRQDIWQPYSENEEPLRDPPLLIMKMGADPINGQDRLEVEVSTDDENIEELGADLAIQGLILESKWARLRTTFYTEDSDLENVLIFLDYNSGFGLVPEIEGPDLETIKEVGESLGWEGDEFTGDVLKARYEEVVADWENHYNKFIQEVQEMGYVL